MVAFFAGVMCGVLIYRWADQMEGERDGES